MQPSPPAQVGESASGAKERLELAERVHVAGVAFTIRLTIRRDPPLARADAAQLADRLSRQLKRRLRRLGPSYQVDAVETGEGSVTWRVAGNQEFVRRRDYGRVRPPWTSAVDRAVEEVRRVARARLERDGSAAVVDASWEPGAGAVATDVGVSADAPERMLRARADELRRRESALASRRVAVFALAAVIGAGSLVGVLLSHDSVNRLLAAYTLLYALAAFLVGLRVSAALNGVRAEGRELAEQLDLRDLLDEDEKRAQRLFQLHSLELKRYYDQALQQRGLIFWVGVLCIAGGFAVIGVTLRIVTHASAGLDEKIVVAVVGSVGTILANFVAVVFLRMFTRTVRSTEQFHVRLVRTNLVHFGNVLAAKIEGRALRDATLADLARSLADASERDDGATPGGEHDGRPTAEAAGRVVRRDRS